MDEEGGGRVILTNEKKKKLVEYRGGEREKPDEGLWGVGKAGRKRVGGTKL